MMKTKQIQLSVPESCHEDWNKMTPKDRGAFCGSCAKVVIDFTKMTDRQLIAFLEKSKGEKTCGKFNPYQLNRKIVATTPTPNFFLQFKKLISGLFFGLSFPALSKAIELPKNSASTFLIDDADVAEKTIIKGTVYTSNGKLIEGAMVRVYISGRITHFFSSTNKAGNFEIKVPMNRAEKKISIIVSAIDFEDKTIEITEDEALSITLDFSYSSNSMILGKMAFLESEIPLDCGVRDQDMQNEVSSIKGEIPVSELIEVDTQELVNIELEKEVDIMGDIKISTTESFSLNKILGKIVDEHGEALPFAKITIQNTQLGVMTDFDGKFELAIPESLEKEAAIHLTVSYVGYENEEFTVNASNYAKEELMVNMKMSPPIHYIMGAMISVPVENTKPNSFDANYQEPNWKEKGFNSRKEYLNYLKMNP